MYQLTNNLDLIHFLWPTWVDESVNRFQTGNYFPVTTTTTPVNEFWTHTGTTTTAGTTTTPIGRLTAGTTKDYCDTMTYCEIVPQINLNLKFVKEILKDFADVLIQGDNFPKINISYDPEKCEYKIQAVIAGYSKEEVRITIDNNYLTFETKKQTKEDESTFLVKEISKSSFKRQIKLPDTIDLEKTETIYNDGIVTITIPVKESNKPKELKF